MSDSGETALTVVAAIGESADIVLLIDAHAHPGEHGLGEAAADEGRGDHDRESGRHVQVLVLRRQVLGLNSRKY